MRLATAEEGAVKTIEYTWADDSEQSLSAEYRKPYHIVAARVQVTEWAADGPPTNNGSGPGMTSRSHESSGGFHPTSF